LKNIATHLERLGSLLPSYLHTLSQYVLGGMLLHIEGKKRRSNGGTFYYVVAL
jgi:hypothetical protein